MTVSYEPEVWDVRASDAGSVSLLPLLGVNDWPVLLEYMQSNWPEFDLIGTHGEERAQPGERWWAVGAVEVKEGPAVFQIQFRQDPDTYDPGNILSFCSWPGAPGLPSGFNPTQDVIYHTRAVYSWSGGADSVGYPYGAGSGPYSFWLNSDPIDWSDRRVGSDALVGVHWFDNHVSCNAVFWPMRKGGSAPPTPPTPPSSGDYLVNMVGGTVTGHIQFVPGPPVGGVPTLGLMRGGQVIAHIPWGATGQSQGKVSWLSRLVRRA
jgi:hypothetical protein